MASKPPQLPTQKSILHRIAFGSLTIWIVGFVLGTMWCDVICDRYLALDLFVHVRRVHWLNPTIQIVGFVLGTVWCDVICDRYLAFELFVHVRRVHWLNPTIWIVKMWM